MFRSKRSNSKLWVALAAMAVSAMAAPAQAQPYVYVLGQAPSPDIISQQLNVYDVATNTRISRILLGDIQTISSESIAMAPDGARIYVINRLEQTVSVVSTQTRSVVGTLPDSVIGVNPNAVTVSPDSQRLYVTHSESVSGQFQGFLSVIDVVSRTRITRIPVGFQSASGVAASPDGQRVYVVAGTSANAVAVIISTATNSVITTVPLPGAAQFFAVSLSPDGRFAYIPRRPTTSQTPGYVQVLDTATDTIVATTTVGIRPGQASVSPDGATVYVPSSLSGEVHQLNRATHASEGATAVASALAVAFLPDGTRAYVAAGGNLVVMDTSTRAVIATIPTLVSRSGQLVGGSAAVVATPPAGVSPGQGGGGGAPGQPTVTAVVASGSTLTISWSPGAGASPTSHRLDFNAGATPVASVTVGAAPSVGIAIPPGTQGTFGVRVIALNGTTAGPPSALFPFALGPSCTVPASPNVSGGVQGGTASVTWPAVAGASSYILSAGTAPGGSEYLQPTNIGAATGTNASGLPAGFTAWVRVIAVNVCGQESVPRDFFVQ